MPPRSRECYAGFIHPLALRKARLRLGAHHAVPLQYPTTYAHSLLWCRLSRPLTPVGTGQSDTLFAASEHFCDKKRRPRRGAENAEICSHPHGSLLPAISEFAEFWQCQELRREPSRHSRQKRKPQGGTKRGFFLQLLSIFAAKKIGGNEAFSSLHLLRKAIAFPACSCLELRQERQRVSIYRRCLPFSLSWHSSFHSPQRRPLR